MKHYYVLVLDAQQTIGIVDSRDEQKLKDDFNHWCNMFPTGRFLPFSCILTNSKDLKEQNTNINYKSVKFFFEVDEETFKKMYCYCEFDTLESFDKEKQTEVTCNG